MREEGDDREEVVVDKTGTINIKTGLALPASAVRAEGSTERTAHSSSVTEPVPSSAMQSIALPLRTAGRFIVDQKGKRVKWSCVNWYGAHMEHMAPTGLHVRSAEHIAGVIRALGFNCVRLPYSTEGYKENPAIQPDAIAALPKSVNQTFLQVLDVVIDALTKAQLMVILNNHVSDAMWCCSEKDDNGLWFNDRYSEHDWLETIAGVAARYRDNVFVVGHDLRNEVRPDMNHMYFPDWQAPSKLNLAVDFAAKFGNESLGLHLPRIYSWRRGAELGGAAVLAADPHALIIVEPYGAAFMCTNELLAYPLRGLDGHIVWSFHDYTFFNKWAMLGEDLCSQSDFTLLDLAWKANTVYNMDDSETQPKDYDDFASRRTASWGHIARDDIGPVWVGEFGFEMTNDSLFTKQDQGGQFWKWIIAYLDETDIDFAYWSLNGESFPSSFSGKVKKHGQDEPFGLLEHDYTTARSEGLVQFLRSLQQPSMGPMTSSKVRRLQNSTGLVPPSRTTIQDGFRAPRPAQILLPAFNKFTWLLLIVVALIFVFTKFYSHNVCRWTGKLFATDWPRAPMNSLLSRSYGSVRARF